MGETFTDTHVHVWDQSSRDHAWLKGDAELDRNFLATDFVQGGGRPEKVVMVEAGCSPEQAIDEVEWVGGLQGEWPALAGMVAFAPLEDRAALLPHLEQLAARPVVKGVRRNFQVEQASFLSESATLAGARQVARAGLAFDACVNHRQLSALRDFARCAPDLTIVLDHLGKPPVASGGPGTGAGRQWAVDLKALADCPNVAVKLSGLAPEADPRRGLAEQALPYLSEALDAFGPQRCMIGSDWPVSMAAPGGENSYGKWIDLVFGRALVGAAPAEKTAIATGNADRLYRL